MCLLFVGWHAHPRYRVVLAANRDEFHSRPTAPAGFWEDHPGLFAGRDLQAGGSWLGVTRAGRFAAVTNYREPDPPTPDHRSRGELVPDVLLAPEAPGARMARLAERGDDYGGFNLLAGDRTGLWYLSNRDGPVRRLGAGVYGLSNGLLDSPWPKVEAGRRDFRAVLEAGGPIEPEALLDLLAEPDPAPGGDLPDTGVGRERERLLSPRFVRSESYGTRCSTAVLIGYDGAIRFVERRFDARGRAVGESRESFREDPAVA